MLMPPELDEDENKMSLDNMSPVKQMIILNSQNQHIKDLLAEYRDKNIEEIDYSDEYLGK